jgi:predicted lysophospholipase L1 biosynthesis ABC-type transport system permease subunit
MVVMVVPRCARRTHESVGLGRAAQKVKPCRGAPEERAIRHSRTSDLMQMVLKHGLTLNAAGVVLGVAVALGTTRLLGYLLYQVSPRDPLAFGSALVVMAITSLAACIFPAWRATRTDPVRALRD